MNEPALTSEPAYIVKAIEEAVLLGGAEEILHVLDLVKYDADFPRNVLYALESIFYLRHHYGKGGDLEPADDKDRRKVQDMESSWGRELLESLDWYPELYHTRID